jgi:hypothetical protein
VSRRAFICNEPLLERGNRLLVAAAQAVAPMFAEFRHLEELLAASTAWNGGI